MAQADAEENGSPQLMSAGKKEFAGLRRHNRVLDQENEIL